MAVLATVLPMVSALLSIPGEIYLIDGGTETLNFSLPFNIKISSASAKDVIKLNGNSLSSEAIYDLSDPLVITTDNTGTTDISLDLMGLIPIKNIKVTVAEEKSLIPGGQSIGVMLYTNGALVVGTMDITTEEGKIINPAREAQLYPGDVIEYLNGEEIVNAEHLSKLINETNSSVELGIRRDNDQKTIVVTPVKDVQDNMLKLGVWVRDSTAGVGTLTFYDPSSKRFGGLGHAISDVDTGKQLSVKDGEIVQSNIIEVVKGESGEPGELKGYFRPEDEVLGTISKNSQYGIYGETRKTLSNQVYTQPIETAPRDTVREGDASILCTLNDEGVKEYSCQIIKVNKQDSPAQKSFVVQIDDERLLNTTGGIVQGMSGSPVIQNGKLIGAVTHVFVNDPTKGYGLYIDWMLNEIK